MAHYCGWKSLLQRTELELTFLIMNGQDNFADWRQQSFSLQNHCQPRYSYNRDGDGAVNLNKLDWSSKKSSGGWVSLCFGLDSAEPFKRSSAVKGTGKYHQPQWKTNRLVAFTIQPICQKVPGIRILAAAFPRMRRPTFTLEATEKLLKTRFFPSKCSTFSNKKLLKLFPNSFL